MDNSNEKVIGQQIYAGKLPRRMRKEDLEKHLEKFGKITDIVMKTGYAFIVKGIRNHLDIRR